MLLLIGNFNLISSPSVEYPNAPAAFLTTTPDKIYNSDKPPALDALFSTTNAVFHLFLSIKNAILIKKIIRFC